LIHASTRHVPLIAVLLALAAAPTWLHHTGRLNVDDCGELAIAFEPMSDGSPPVGDGEAARRRKRLLTLYGDGSWVEGRVSIRRGGPRLTTVVVRSFDPKTIYHWPGNRVIGTRPERTTLETVTAGAGQLPIHRLHYPRRSERGRKVKFAAYLLVYGGELVRNPYLAQLLSAPRQVVAGRMPMWLFFVFGDVHPADLDDAEQSAVDWLLDSWHRYQEACRP
jgi:hypothetical protein